MSEKLIEAGSAVVVITICGIMGAMLMFGIIDHGMYYG